MVTIKEICATEKAVNRAAAVFKLKYCEWLNSVCAKKENYFTPRNITNNNFCFNLFRYFYHKG